jgi:hypothetical protein
MITPTYRPVPTPGRKKKRQTLMVPSLYKGLVWFQKHLILISVQSTLAVNRALGRTFGPDEEIETGTGKKSVASNCVSFTNIISVNK